MSEITGEIDGVKYSSKIVRNGDSLDKIFIEVTVDKTEMLQKINKDLVKLEDEDNAHLADKFGDPDYDNMLPYKRTPETWAVVRKKIDNLKKFNFMYIPM